MIGGFVLTMMVSMSLSAMAYESPYGLSFDIPLEELCAADAQPPRNNIQLESTEVAFSDWYSDATQIKCGAWGPHPRQYPPPNASSSMASSAWQRQRLLAVAQRMIGLDYQHHHIPDWDPPASWPWKEVSCGRNSKGVDCSNFTAWLYNYGLGIYLNSDVQKQAAITEIQGPGGIGNINITAITNDNGYDDLVAKLQAGDLLYINNRKGELSHVVMWVGQYGKSPDRTPLIIDCTGSAHKDSNGQDIPTGVQLRPFKRDGWYYRSFSHAHRII